MDPVDFKARNTFLGAPKKWNEMKDGPCGRLPLHHEFPNGLAWTSCWKPTKRELQILNNGGKVWLEVCSGSTPQPAVALYANYENGIGPEPND